MFQDIDPHRLDMTYAMKTPEDGDWLVALRNGRMAVLKDGDTVRGLPTVGMARTAIGRDAPLLHLFSVDGVGVHLYTGEAPESAGTAWLGAGDMHAFRTIEPAWLGFVGITAAHLGQWYLANRFCGFCGGATARKADERAVECPGCGQIVYPRISPAVITGVTDGDRILLTRYANRPGSRLSALIAGFMEVGETFEDTVRREVREEVGLEVGNIRYYKSQPWGFSGSVLAGFYADLLGSAELILDRMELQEARWFPRKDLPSDIDTFSLTAEMIETFRLGRHPE